MAASQLSLYASGSSQRSGGRPAAVKQLLSRLRSTWRRRSAARPRRAEVRSFGYDLHSYSQNLDDGLASSGHHSCL
ncbi:unnamed protein product [Urochloa decumbens]|uniref:Uncharacterized protein n=1 Tax=Urochloa decumbens TaxID=240449 RepID=A0ABC8XDQ2_9POAL